MYSGNVTTCAMSVLSRKDYIFFTTRNAGAVLFGRQRQFHSLPRKS
jgi:hypothetical protein